MIAGALGQRSNRYKELDVNLSLSRRSQFRQQTGKGWQSGAERRSILLDQPTHNDLSRLRVRYLGANFLFKNISCDAVRCLALQMGRKFRAETDPHLVVPFQLFTQFSLMLKKEIGGTKDKADERWGGVPRKLSNHRVSMIGLELSQTNQVILRRPKSCPNIPATPLFYTSPIHDGLAQSI